MVVTFDIRAHSRKASFPAFYSLFGHWHCACTVISQRGQALVAKTDSAANQFGAPESVNQRGIFPLLVASVCPSHIRRISKQESDYEDPLTHYRVNRTRRSFRRSLT